MTVGEGKGISKNLIKFHFPTWKIQTFWERLHDCGTSYRDSSDPALDWGSEDSAVNLKPASSLVLWKCSWIRTFTFTVYSFVFGLSEYLNIHRLYTEGIINLLEGTALADSPSFLLLSLVKTWLNSSVYLAHTLSILLNNNTCVPNFLFSATASFLPLAEPAMCFEHVYGIFVVFICFKKDECHFHFMDPFIESLTAGCDVSSEEGCLSVDCAAASFTSIWLHTWCDLAGSQQ